MATLPLDKASEANEDVGYEFLLYGHEHILRGSDTSVLAAFAVLAYQGLSGANQPHHVVGFTLLVVSVMMCAVVHFAVGSLFAGRARRLLRGQKLKVYRQKPGHLATIIAWTAGGVQLIAVLTGALIVLWPV